MAWTTDVAATSAVLHAEVNPEGSTTAYHFDYITQAAYEANLAASREGFSGAAKAPAGTDPSIGAGSAAVAVHQPIGSLAPQTSYRYRVVATSHCNPAQPSEACTEESSPHAFATEALGGEALLLDDRGWEMVSPPAKNGGDIAAPGQLDAGGVLQAAADGNSASFDSATSFGEGAQGAPPASQYLAFRTAAGWHTQNISPPAVSGSYGDRPNGVPYQLFSPDLAHGLMLNGSHCRDTGSGCPIANPPLPGSGAPPGYQDYYLRSNANAAYQALITEADLAGLSLSPDTFSVSLAGATPDLRHIVLSTCAKLTPDATEQPACESGGPNLYEWSGGALRLINRLGSDSLGTSDAHLAAQSGAISADGQRVYFTVGEEAALYLREGEAGAKPVAELSSFQTASADGSVAFYTKEEGGSGRRLYRYETSGERTTDLTPQGEVKGVLGASADGSVVYYQDAAGLKQWHEGSTTTIATGPEAAQQSDWPPTTGTARVSADGRELLFLSKAGLTGYDNTPSEPSDCGHEVAGVFHTEPCQEVFLWSTTGGGLSCLSCNPTNERPLGPSTIPGAYANGTEEALGPGQILTDSYKPRALSQNGRRAFFDSRDSLVLTDTNNTPDVYEWEAQGEGSCARVGGCLALVSGGREKGASFVDASANGSDAFFLTESSLAAADHGSADLYDAREGGGFPEPPTPIECKGDACQHLPPEPEDPQPGTLGSGPPNPPLVTPKPRRCRRRFARRHGRCVKPKRHHRGRR